jgi:Putative glycolipid-binding
MADELKRVVVWKNLLLNGTDYCGLWHTAEGWLVKGTVVGVLKDQRPMLANYQIHCDDNWLTHRVQVERTIGNDVKNLSLTVAYGVVLVRSCVRFKVVKTLISQSLPRPTHLQSGVSTYKLGAARPSSPLGSNSPTLGFNHYLNAIRG